MSKKYVCVLGGGEGWVRRGGVEGVKRACPLRVYVMLFYVFIYFYYPFCLVYLFYECDKLDFKFFF